MIEHGIHTTKCLFWLHFHPLDRAVYYYFVRHCLDYIRQHKLQPTDAASKDPARTITARGYKIPKTAPFLMKAVIGKSYLSDQNFMNMTDREFGQWGQSVVDIMISKGEIWLPGFRVLKTTPAEDLAGVDVKISSHDEVKIQIKSDRKDTPNIYVQTEEGGHRVHNTPSGEFRFSDLT